MKNKVVRKEPNQNPITQNLDKDQGITDIENLIHMLNEADKEGIQNKDKGGTSKINFSDFPLDIQELVLDHMSQ